MAAFYVHNYVKTREDIPMPSTAPGGMISNIPKGSFGRILQVSGELLDVVFIVEGVQVRIQNRDSARFIPLGFMQQMTLVTG